MNGNAPTAARHTVADDRNATSRSGNALVLTGGALRASYGAGAVRALAELGLTDFQVAQAVSGSAPTLAYFAAGQLDELGRIWRHLVPSGRFVRETDRAPNGNGNGEGDGSYLFDTSYLVDRVMANEIPLDRSRLAGAAIRCRFLAARLEAGGELALDGFGNDHPDMAGVLKACLALPWAAEAPITVAGRQYVDASLLEPVPITWEGQPLAARTLVILNRPTGRRPSLFWPLTPVIFNRVARKLPLSECFTQDLMLRGRRTVAKLAAAERRGELMVLAPSRPTPTPPATRDPRRVEASLDLGWADVMTRRHEIESFLAGRSNARSRSRAGFVFPRRPLTAAS